MPDAENVADLPDTAEHTESQGLEAPVQSAPAVAGSSASFQAPVQPVPDVAGSSALPQAPIQSDPNKDLA